MKLIKINHQQVTDQKKVHGLVGYQIEYEVKSAKGILEYHGPKLSLELWHQVLSFFRWTYKEMQSECQVRLYVNLKLGRWAAWAFPQEARTGMTAREVSVQESPEKARERFAAWLSEPSDDWLYFGTVHHHCSASAFQSSTDEQNEWNQDGLHITVGKIDEERHDLHARFYVSGNCFEPDLSCFWPLDAELSDQVPQSMHHDLACYQMSGKITVDFPDAWRQNLVESRPEPRKLVPRRRLLFDDDWPPVPLEVRAEDAFDEISRNCALLSVPEEQWMKDLQAFSASETHQIIIAACLRHGITPGELEVPQPAFEY